MLELIDNKASYIWLYIAVGAAAIMAAMYLLTGNVAAGWAWFLVLCLWVLLLFKSRNLDGMLLTSVKALRLADNCIELARDFELDAELERPATFDWLCETVECPAMNRWFAESSTIEAIEAVVEDGELHLDLIKGSARLRVFSKPTRREVMYLFRTFGFHLGV